tara:strand:+ start:216 stop:656 length:441 start_codon:yes stop_codon:yes gene_type:complete
MAGYTPDTSAFPYFGGSVKIKQKALTDLYDFKNRAQETCGAHVVMADLMDRVERSENNTTHWRTRAFDLGLSKRKNDMEIMRLKRLVSDLTCVLEDAEIPHCDKCGEYKIDQADFAYTWDVDGIEGVLGYDSLCNVCSEKIEAGLA